MASSVLVLLSVVAITEVAQCRMVKLSCAQVRLLVDEHNACRVKLARGGVHGQPAPTDIKMMMWDDELSAKASDWAAKDQFVHNPDRDVESGRFQTGENIFIYKTTKSSNIDLDQVIYHWFSEYKNYLYAPMSLDDFTDPNRPTGHYTQMVWSNSTYLGCAMSRTQTTASINIMVICNYEPQGNIIGKEPYQIAGPPQHDLYCSTGDCSTLYGEQC